MRSGLQYRRGAELTSITGICADRLIRRPVCGVDLLRHGCRTGWELVLVRTGCAQSSRSVHPDSCLDGYFCQGLLEGCEIFWPIVVKRTDALMNRKLGVTPADGRKLTLPIADPARACLGVF